MIAAVICDDHRLFGESFANALRAEGAEATVTSIPQEALTAMEQTRVDRVVMNAFLPAGTGLTAIRRIRDTWPQTHISCVGVDDPARVSLALDAGASALLSKKYPLSELVDAVLLASGAYGRAAGRSPIQPVAPRPTSAHKARNCPLAAQFLTQREREVLQLLVCAKTTDGIAHELGISVTTTRGYVQSILEKLGVHSRVEAVTYAIRHSVVC